MENKIKVVGRLSGGPWDKRHDICKRVYDPDGIAPTLTAGGGGGVEPKIIVRNNMSKINMLGLLDVKGQENVRRVYGIDGIAPCLTTSQGGNRQPKILVGGEMIIDDKQTGREGKPRFYTEVAPTLAARDYKGPLMTYGGETMKTLRVNDLFCGAGGMGIGFKQVGFETAGAWDFDKYAVQSYAHNVDKVVKQADITEMSYEDMQQADVWTFGFPCQDLSVAGKQAGLFEGKRSGLFFEVMRLLDEAMENDLNRLPRIIMAENVKGLKPYLGVLEEEYKKRGYKMVYTLYNSKFWGVPQNRERYFVVGVHESIEKEFIYPTQQEHYIPRLSTVLEPVVDEKYYISDEKATKIIEQAKAKIEKTPVALTETRTDEAKEIRRESMKQGKDFSPRRGKILVPRNDEIGNCCTATVGKEHLLLEELQKASGLLDLNKEGRCLRVGGKGSLTPKHNYEHLVTNDFRVRKLTPREYGRLQGFPETFELVVSDSQAYKQFGNAVTVNVSRAIAERIRMFLLSL